MVHADDDVEPASAGDVAEEVSRLRTLLGTMRPPAGPIDGRWSIGLGDLLNRHPKVPKRLHGAVHQLNKFGGFGISDRGLTFGGDEIKWAAITEISSRNFIEYLTSYAVQRQLDTFPVSRFLPGRRKVVDVLTQALLTVLLTAAKEQLERGQDIRIPVEIDYRGRIRRHRKLTPGVFTTLVMADPAVDQCLRATADAHGVTIREIEDRQFTNAAQRADHLRACLRDLETRLRSRRTGA